MQLRSSLLLLLLLLLPRRLQAEREEEEKEEEEVQALVGSSVALPCVYPESARFELGDLYVYWQIKVDNKPKTVAWSLGGSSTAGATCEKRAGCEWWPGAELAPADMRRGNFTLRLADVGPRDEHSFLCLVFNASLGLRRVLERRVRLRVAASYSTPVVTPGEPVDGNLVFTCTSSHGYPPPTVHWFDGADGRPLDSRLQNVSLRPEARGLYTVVSVLPLRGPGPSRVGCCVENARLGQNLSGVQAETSFRASTTPRPPQETSATMPVLLTLGVVLVGIVVTIFLLYRSHWSSGRYTGVREARWTPQLPDLSEEAARQPD